MNASEINSLNDLRKIRTAPELDKNKQKILIKELTSYMNKADWFTIGIMAHSSKQAIFALKEMEYFFNWTAMEIATEPKEDGPVFLKANQKTGTIHVRIEYGLGEGILISCQYDDKQKLTDTFGPLPLKIFKIKY